MLASQTSTSTTSCSSNTNTSTVCYTSQSQGITTLPAMCNQVSPVVGTITVSSGACVGPVIGNVSGASSSGLLAIGTNVDMTSNQQNTSKKPFIVKLKSKSIRVCQAN